MSVGHGGVASRSPRVCARGLVCVFHRAELRMCRKDFCVCMDVAEEPQKLPLVVAHGSESLCGDCRRQRSTLSH